MSRLIDADDIAYESIDSSDTDRYAYYYGTGIIAVRKEDIEAMPTIELPRWIPCSERLPKEKDAGILKKLGTEKRSEYVLVTVEVNGERMVAQACTKDGVWDWDMKYAFPGYKVVAWMSMPSAWEGEVNEG